MHALGASCATASDASVNRYICNYLSGLTPLEFILCLNSEFIIIIIIIMIIIIIVFSAIGTENLENSNFLQNLKNLTNMLFFTMTIEYALV